MYCIAIEFTVFISVYAVFEYYDIHARGINMHGSKEYLICFNVHFNYN
jgi:hypothetical protein